MPAALGSAACGTGVGKQLLQYAIEHLQVDEVDVNEQNPQGVGFYLHSSGGRGKLPAQLQMQQRKRIPFTVKF